MYNTVPPDEKLYRYRTVEAFMYAGIPMAKTDDCRPLLWRSGHALTDSSALGVFVPKFEAKELETIKGELRGEHVSICFDPSYAAAKQIDAAFVRKLAVIKPLTEEEGLLTAMEGELPDYLAAASGVS